jgi:hypothetical protein
LPKLADEINNICRRGGISTVLPSDGRTTRTLIRVRERLSFPTFPVPYLPTFDTLNDKWASYLLCDTIRVRTPRSELFETKTDLVRAFSQGRLPLPAIVKPTNKYGGKSVKKVTQSYAGQVLHSIDYNPILFQEFIDGEDVCISLFCKEGAPTHAVQYREVRRRFQYFENAELYQEAARIAYETRFTGVINDFSIVHGRSAAANARAFGCLTAMIWRRSFTPLIGRPE